MKCFSVLYPRYAPGSWGFVLVLFALIALPYVVDVAYFGDFTPTHFAQENLSEEEGQAFDGEDSSGLAKDQIHPAHHEILLLLERLSFSEEHVSLGDFFLPHYMIAASLISRPPPVL